MAQKLGQPIAAISKIMKGIIRVVFTVSSTSSGKTNKQTVVFWKRQMSQLLSPLLSRSNFIGLVTLSAFLCPCSQRRSSTVNWPMNGRRNQRVAEQWKCFKGILKHNLKQCSIKHMKWEQLANEQPSWRSAIHTGVAHSEQQRKEHSEELCLARKERQQDASVVPSSTEVTCPVCRSILSSRIGLYSQQRTHVNLVNFI